MNSTITQTVRKTSTQRFRVNTKELQRKHVKKIGVFAAVKVSDNTVKVGWSKCMKGDKFSPASGRDIAIQRAQGIYRGTYTVPQALSANLEDFLNRCKRYFKDATVEVAKT